MEIDNRNLLPIKTSLMHRYCDYEGMIQVCDGEDVRLFTCEPGNIG